MLVQKIIVGSMVIVSLASCKKTADDTANVPAGPQFIKYTIRAGQQFCDPNDFKQTDYTELKFIARFDSSAVYQTLSQANQLDINKLYGFSDNNAEHQQFSARIGWRWSGGALRLFGYIYNNGIRDFEEITIISIGEEHTCSIKVTSASYIFSVGNTSKTMLRTSTTATAKGYKLYPYFGGDEKAPHDINVWIKEL